MGTRQVVVLSLVALSVALVGSALGAGTHADTAQLNASTNSSLGQQISSFMQASVADADAATEQGMWRVAVNRSEHPADNVTDRVGGLERKLTQLQARTERLEARRANGTIPEVAYTAQASGLRAQIQQVRAAINDTSTVAKQVGIETTDIDDLRAQAADVTGPALPAAARNITDPPRGPPGGVPGDGPDGQEAGEGPPVTGEQEDNRTVGPPGNPGERERGATDRSPPTVNHSDTPFDQGNESETARTPPVEMPDTTPEKSTSTSSGPNAQPPEKERTGVEPPEKANTSVATPERGNEPAAPPSGPPANATQSEMGW